MTDHSNDKSGETELRRWRCVTKGVGLDAWAEMVPDQNGAYVLYSDTVAPSHVGQLTDDASDKELLATLAKLRESLWRGVIPGDAQVTIMTAEGAVSALIEQREVAHRQMNDAEQARLELARSSTPRVSGAICLKCITPEHCIERKTCAFGREQTIPFSIGHRG